MSLNLTRGRSPAVRILGPVEVVGRCGVPVAPGGKAARVLAALALYSGEWVPTGRLVDLVWPDQEPPVSATNNLKTYVWQLRRLLGPVPDTVASDAPVVEDDGGTGTARNGAANGDGGTHTGGPIESRSGGYRLRLEPGDLDADLVLAAAGRTAELLRAGHAAEVADLVPEVLGLWRGRPYDEIAGHCAHPAIARLAEQRCALREDLAEAYLRLGRVSDAIEVLVEVTAEDPLRELTWVRLIDTLRRAGRTRDALAAYQDARKGLLRELGVEPGPELVAAHQAVLAGEAVPAGEPVAARECAGEHDHAAGHIGGHLAHVAGHGWPVPHQLPRPVDVPERAVELADLVEAGRTGGGVPVLTVSGPTGAGKTALAVAAGHALAERFPDGQLFVDLRATRSEDLTTGEALGRLVRAVAGPCTWLPDSLDERAALWRSVSYGRRLLLLADDVRDGEHLWPLLPASPGCLVLATSRNRITGIGGHTEIRLGGPSRSLPERAGGPASRSRTTRSETGPPQAGRGQAGPNQTHRNQTSRNQLEVRVA